MNDFVYAEKSLVNPPSYPAVCPMEWNYDSVVHYPRQANSFVYRCNVAQSRKKNYLFQVTYLPFLLNLVPYGKIFPGKRKQKPKPNQPQMYNTTDARNTIHINISKSKQGENFCFENICIFFFANISDIHCLKLRNWNYNPLDWISKGNEWL